MTCLPHVGRIAHELGHVLGLFDEHVRIDRDYYIAVNMNNVWNTGSYQILSDYSFISTPYDLGSIMHYSSFNGDAINLSFPVFTVRDNIAYHGVVGQREYLSIYDVVAVNTMYECNECKYTLLLLYCCSELIENIEPFTYRHLSNRDTSSGLKPVHTTRTPL